MQENNNSISTIYPTYYAVIPANIRYDENLRPNEKLLYGEITALTNKYGICYASNNYFARLYKVEPAAISKWVSDLKENGYLDVEYIYEGKAIKFRKIKLIGINKNKYLLTKNGEGYSQNQKENNTSNNNIEEYKKDNKKEIFEYDWLGDDDE